ncbi:MAG: 3-phosphoglycerate dehydrogenase family protein [Eubacteriales bacterium]|nr:3-phosphoglycerate dehydrogenase family protein [Eubacteriales bacterium]
MKKVQLLNKIAKAGLDLFDTSKYSVRADIDNPDGILVRSADLLKMEFSNELKAIARAGAGVNNIPVQRCTEQGIVVFNTPGANANGVKELTIASLLLASRDIVGGIKWINEQTGKAGIDKSVEKEKSRFAGSEIEGKTLGVIGLGAIGGMVANAARNLGMDVIGYDPYITVDAAWGLSRSIKRASGYDEIYKNSDYITLHAPATEETKGMFCEAAFAKMKTGVRIINLSRSDLINNRDMLKALQSKKVACYVTDFPTDDMVGVEGVIAIPHLGASTNESEDNCALLAVQELIEYLENGNIKNSVNYPDASMPHVGDSRICVLHKNIPNILSQISAAISAEKINIENMLNRSKKEYAYTIVEIIGDIPKITLDTLYNIDGIIRINIY